MIPSKTVSESAIRDYVYRVFPSDLNSNYTVFGGLLMSLLDKIGSVVAERHSGHAVVTASVDSMHFLAPAGSGEILICMAAINRSWHTSMEIGGKVVAQNYRTGELKHIVSAYYTFVALDDHQKPVAVPQVIPETSDEKRRFQEADDRRERRRIEAAERKLNRERFKNTT